MTDEKKFKTWKTFFIAFKPWSYETLAAKMLDKSLKNDEAVFTILFYKSNMLDKTTDRFLHFQLSFSK